MPRLNFAQLPAPVCYRITELEGKMTENVNYYFNCDKIIQHKIYDFNHLKSLVALSIFTLLCNVQKLFISQNFIPMIDYYSYCLFV